MGLMDIYFGEGETEPTIVGACSAEKCINYDESLSSNCILGSIDMDSDGACSNYEDGGDIEMDNDDEDEDD